MSLGSHVGGVLVIVEGNTLKDHEDGPESLGLPRKSTWSPLLAIGFLHRLNNVPRMNNAHIEPGVDLCPVPL